MANKVDANVVESVVKILKTNVFHDGNAEKRFTDAIEAASDEGDSYRIQLDTKSLGIGFEMGYDSCEKLNFTAINSDFITLYFDKETSDA